jgi:ATP-binding cassette, subfamily B, bacterial
VSDPPGQSPDSRRGFTSAPPQARSAEKQTQPRRRREAPKASTAARFLIALGLRVDRARLIRAVTLMLAGYVAAPLAAVVAGRFTDDAVAGRTAPLTGLAVALAALLVAALMAAHFAHLDYFELAELQETGLRAELIALVNGPPTISHLDDGQFADDLSLVRESLFANTRALEAVLQLGGLVVQTAITAAILVTLNPWLGLLPLLAVPPALLARTAQAVYERARERTAEPLRLSRHLIELATTAASVKELRIAGAQDELLARQAAAWSAVTTGLWRGQLAGAAWRAAGQVIFALGYAGAIFLLVRQVTTGAATIGDLIVVITLAVQVSTQITGALQLLGLLQATGQTVRRIEALRAAGMPAAPSPAVPSPAAAGPVPERLTRGITLEHVSFCYPGSGRSVLRDVSLAIPAGTTLALVGENGAGKSTLVKLLTGLYRPSSGRILADGANLAGLDPARWRAQTATLFQDFYRFEFTLREGIGLGQVDRLDDDRAVARAVTRARAGAVVDALPGGLDGYTGRGYADGADLSGGQWQTIGLARCLMRERPLLLILDEPAAALDAAAEHALFERYAAASAAAARQTGGITILISHRFSTAAMADAIAVLDDGRLVEHGRHDDLLARGGSYAELFRLQARAYR